MLDAQEGAEIEISASGPDAKICVSELEQLISSKFFRPDFWTNLTHYIFKTAEQNVDLVFAVICSTKDLYYWYSITDPNISASDLAETVVAGLSGKHQIQTQYNGPWKQPKIDEKKALVLATENGTKTAIVDFETYKLLQYGSYDLARLKEKIVDYLSKVER